MDNIDAYIAKLKMSGYSGHVRKSGINGEDVLEVYGIGKDASELVIPKACRVVNIAGHKNQFIRLRFDGCKLDKLHINRATIDVDFTGADLSQQEEMEQFLYGCTINKMKGICELDTSSVINMGEAFACADIGDNGILDLSKWNLQSVLIADRMFRMFNGRRLILDLRSAVNISIATGMFKEAYLEELSISNFALNGADISGLFSGAGIHKLTLYNVKLINCICSGFSEI